MSSRYKQPSTFSATGTGTLELATEEVGVDDGVVDAAVVGGVPLVEVALVVVGTEAVAVDMSPVLVAGVVELVDPVPLGAVGELVESSSSHAALSRSASAGTMVMRRRMHPLPSHTVVPRRK
jgi:hypothetical protein